MTAVRSFANTTAERNADLGAWSIELRVERPIRRQIVSHNDCGTGKSAKNIAEGRCVKTIVFTRPMRLAIEEAKILPTVDRNHVADMIDPSFVFGR